MSAATESTESEIPEVLKDFYVLTRIRNDGSMIELKIIVYSSMIYGSGIVICVLHCFTTTYVHTRTHTHTPTATWERLVAADQSDKQKQNRAVVVSERFSASHSTVAAR